MQGLSRQHGMKRAIHTSNRCSLRRQAGMTTIGFIILAAFVGLIAFGAMRLTPVYLNYFKVVGVMDGILDEFDGQNATRAVIRRSLNRRFDIESVGVITYRDVTVTAVDSGFEVAAVYDHTAPFIANISFTVHFNKTVVVRR